MASEDNSIGEEASALAACTGGCKVETSTGWPASQGGCGAGDVHRTELFFEFTDLIQDAAFEKVNIEKLRKTFLDDRGRLHNAADKEALREAFRHNDAKAERDELSISIVKQ